MVAVILVLICVLNREFPGSKKPQAPLPSSQGYWALLLDVTKHMASLTWLFLRKIFLAEMARDCFLSLQILDDKKCQLLHCTEQTSLGWFPQNLGDKKTRIGCSSDNAVQWQGQCCGGWERAMSLLSDLRQVNSTRVLWHLSGVFFRWVFWWEVPV